METLENVEIEFIKPAVKRTPFFQRKNRTGKLRNLGGGIIGQGAGAVIGGIGKGVGAIGQIGQGIGGGIKKGVTMFAGAKSQQKATTQVEEEKKTDALGESEFVQPTTEQVDNDFDVYDLVKYNDPKTKAIEWVNNEFNEIVFTFKNTKTCKAPKAISITCGDDNDSFAQSWVVQAAQAQDQELVTIYENNATYFTFPRQTQMFLLPA